MGVRVGGRMVAAAAVMAACLPFAPARGSDEPAFLDSFKSRLFLFGGFEVARDSTFGWTGIVGAPFGSIDVDGPRLRLMGGYGRYRYDQNSAPGGTNEGTVSSGEFMIGWRRAFDAATVVAYIGAHVVDHRLRFADPGNPVSGTEAGVKALIELHARPWPDFVATAFASASTVHGSYHARATLTREFNSNFAFGIEGAVLGDARYVEPRVGLLVSTTIWQRSLTLSGGYLSNSDKGGGSYLTVSLYAPF